MATWGGKTTLVRHWLRALGVQGRIKSPTYAVVEPHEAGDLSIWHFDFYRFDDPRVNGKMVFATFLPAPDSSWQNGPKRLQRLHLLRI
jgi:tRNA threonylcarbamoyl adenosine modification protein YjeE